MALIEASSALSDWLGPISYTPMVRLLVAALLGALIGWERERHGRAAGLRTHLLLCVGCALLMLISLYLPRLFFEYTPAANVRVNPGRVAAQAISGLGFLEAGAILVLGQKIRGLTTAACIWVTAAIGLAVGAGYLLPAVFAWGVTILALLVVGRLEHRMAKKDRYVNLVLVFSTPGKRAQRVRELLAEHNMDVLSYAVDREKQTARYRFALRYIRAPEFEEVTADLADGLAQEDLERLEWTEAAGPL